MESAFRALARKKQAGGPSRLSAGRARCEIVNEVVNGQYRQGSQPNQGQETRASPKDAQVITARQEADSERAPQAVGQSLCGERNIQPFMPPRRNLRKTSRRTAVQKELRLGQGFVERLAKLPNVAGYALGPDSEHPRVDTYTMPHARCPQTR